MPLGMEVGLSPGDFVLDGDAAPPQKGTEPPIFGLRLLWRNGCMDQDMPLGRKVGLGLRDIVYDGDPAPPPIKGIALQFSGSVRGQTAE